MAITALVSAEQSLKIHGTAVIPALTVLGRTAGGVLIPSVRTASDGTPYRTTAGKDAINVFLMSRPQARELTLPTLGGAHSAARLDGGSVSLTDPQGVRIALDGAFAGPAPHVVVLEGARCRHG